VVAAGIAGRHLSPPPSPTAIYGHRLQFLLFPAAIARNLRLDADDITVQVASYSFTFSFHFPIDCRTNAELFVAHDCS
jgi:hypothetical protein